MAQAQFSGVLVPAITPFKADYSVDSVLFNKVCHWLMAQGANGLAVFGTTSEANSLTMGERQSLLEGLVASGIDPHVHLKWYSPHPDGSVTYTDPPSVVGRAALYGGTTTMIDFVRWTHGKTIRQAIDDRHARIGGEALDDRLLVGADHDEIDHARDDARDVFERLAAAHLRVARHQRDDRTAELVHAGFERHSGARRGFLEEQSKRFPR